MSCTGQMQQPGYIGRTWFILSNGQSELVKTLQQALNFTKFNVADLSGYVCVLCFMH